NNNVVNVGADLNLALEAEIGFIGTEFTKEIGDEWSFPIFHKDVGSIADITEKIESYKEKLQKEGERLKYAAAGMLLFGPVGALVGYYGPQIVQGVEDAGKYVSEKAAVVGKAAQQAAENA